MNEGIGTDGMVGNDHYRMTVDLNVLDHLGINLYSNIAAVLTEAVANAWDADAENVEIGIDPDGKFIEIKDDGIGMSIEDMNTKYLRVGYRRRDEDRETGRTTAKGRPVMGRKGLGKLSLFSIANTIEVHSAKNGESHGLRMTIDGIHRSVQDKEPFYSPEKLPREEIRVTNGTLILLKDIKRQRLGRGATALRKRLARRFSVIGEAHGFKILIDGHPISTADRGDLPMVQFLWSFGDEEPDLSSAGQLLEREALSDRLDAWDGDWSVTGWIGTARLPKQLDSDDARRRDRRQRRGRGAGPLRVPHVDDQPAGRVPGVLHQFESVGDGLDIRPGKELDPQARPHIVGLAGQVRELLRPVSGIPRLTGLVRGHLEFAGVQFLGEMEHPPAHLIGVGAALPGGPPIAQELRLPLGDAVVRQDVAHRIQSIGLLRLDQVGVEEAHASESGVRGQFDPLAEIQRRALIGVLRTDVAR